MADKIHILFLCTGNSCRSQMAEGWTRHLKAGLITVESAGVEIHGLNPHAVTVMAEAGIDISSQRSQHIDEFKGIDFDYVITVCDHAHQTCPWFPSNSKVIHIGFDDPPKLANAFENIEDQLDCYRKVRDEIKAFVETLPHRLESRTGPGQ